MLLPTESTVKQKNQKKKNRKKEVLIESTMKNLKTHSSIIFELSEREFFCVSSKGKFL